ncbi:MAG: metal-dependent hydrolase [Planifilum sp.]
MTGKTHLALGLGLGAATAAVMEPAPTLNEATLTILVSGTAAMLPDIDDDNSTVNQVFLPFLPASLRSWGLAALGLLVIILYVFRDWPLWTLLSGIYALCVAFADHRGISHSLLALIYVTWTAYLASPMIAPAVAVGYGSHLLADAVTTGGIPFCWPWKKRLGLRNFGLRIPTGGKLDEWAGKMGLLGTCVIFTWLVYRRVMEEGLAALGFFG